MKAEQRKRWLELAVSKEQHICTYCRYVGLDWDGDGEYHCWQYQICEHPLEKVRDSGVLSDCNPIGTDCWGFRPAKQKEAS